MKVFEGRQNTEKNYVNSVISVCDFFDIIFFTKYRICELSWEEERITFAITTFFFSKIQASNYF